MSVLISSTELERKIYLRYGCCITIKRPKDKQEYSLEERIVFVRENILYKHKKEFVYKIQDILYRNYYWMDSPYKINSFYENLRNDLDGYSKNTEYYLPITMEDGYHYYFYPEYVNEKENTFLHYFDMSWFCDVHSPRQILKDIYTYFNNSKTDCLISYEADSWSRDYD